MPQWRRIRSRYCRPATASEKGAISPPTTPASHGSRLAPWCGICHGSHAKRSAKCAPGSFGTSAPPRCVGQDRRIGCHRALAPGGAPKGCDPRRSLAAVATDDRGIVYPTSLKSPESGRRAFPGHTWRSQRSCSTQACGWAAQRSDRAPRACRPEDEACSTLSTEKRRSVTSSAASSRMLVPRGGSASAGV
jgi:hypothetical protein